MGRWRRPVAACALLFVGGIGLSSLRGETRDIVLPPSLRPLVPDEGEEGRARGPRHLCLGSSSFDLDAPLDTWSVGRERRPRPRECLSPLLPFLPGAELLAAARSATERESIALVRLDSGHGELDALVRASRWTALATKQVGSSFVGAYAQGTARLDAFAWSSRASSSVALLVLHSPDPREP